MKLHLDQCLNVYRALKKYVDNYFGSIPGVVLKFFSELEFQSAKLGIPLKTRHNEVAPSQFETAPVFSDVNIANDQNQILMELINRVADKHDMKALLYENRLLL